MKNPDATFCYFIKWHSILLYCLIFIQIKYIRRKNRVSQGIFYLSVSFSLCAIRFFRPEYFYPAGRFLSNRMFFVLTQKLFSFNLERSDSRISCFPSALRMLK